MKPARYWHKVDEEKIQCDVCPRHCQLRDGKRGFCFVRQNIGGELHLTTYGRSSGFCIDPIEKKPLNHFLPGTPVLSFGTAGCNLGCQFCQNWDISKAREMDTLQDEASPQAIAKAALDSGCRSVAFTYNDPTIFLEYAIDVAHACHDLGLKTVAVSAGYIEPEARRDLYQVIDAANIDLKAFTQQFYESLCFGNLQPVLDTLLYLKHETQVWIEITTLLIPGQNDSEGEIDQLSRWIYHNLGPDVPLHFSAFHPDYKMRDTLPTPAQTLTKARYISMANGLHYVYTGNVHDTAGSSTYCPTCQTRLLERDWYVLGEYHIKNGACEVCKTPIAGYFENRVGTWGPKRQKVRVNNL